MRKPSPLPWFFLLFLVGHIEKAHALPLVYSVNDSRDLPDLVLSDGICRVNPGPGPAKCTLRAAVQQANYSAVFGATITLPTGTYQLTQNDSDGDEDLDTTKNIVVAGTPGGEALIEVASGGNGDGLGRVFDVHAGTLELQFVQIANSRTAPDYQGACLRVASGAGLVLDAAEVYNCWGSGSDGGAIYNQGTLTLKPNTALWNNRTWVTSPPAGRGGSIFNGDTGVVSVVGQSSITNSHAAQGGGIFNLNVVTGVYLTVSGNDARGGGGIYSRGTLTFTGLQVDHNASIGDGGGIYQVGHGLSLLGQSTVSNNVATEQGGGIYVVGEPTESIFLSDTALDDDLAYLEGGGIYSAGPIVELVNATFKNDTSRRSGGAIATVGDVECSQGCRFETNRCWATGGAPTNAECGGAIYSAENVWIYGSTFWRNGTDPWVNARGGAIAAAHPYLDASTFDTNGTGGAGGAVYVSDSGWVQSSTFSENETTDDGGAIALGPTATTLAVRSSTFRQNYGWIFGTTLKLMNGTVSLANTVIVDDGAENSIECTLGGIDSLGYNFISGIQFGCGLTGLSAYDTTGDNSSARLGALRSLGGPTSTVAMLGDSVLIDAGNPAGCANHSGAALTSDQRGYARSYDGNADDTARCDIGAYEFGVANGYVAFTSTSPTVTEGEELTLTIRRYGPTDDLVMVNCTAKSGTASYGSDFFPTFAGFVWPAGNRDDQTMTIPVYNDFTVEPTETFKVECTSSSSIEVGASPTVSILDND